ncbi:hypothetical protein T484DRAFT_1891239, partial [Baffinella frigidus]
MGEEGGDGGFAPPGGHETAARHPEAGGSDLGGTSHARGGPPSAGASPAGDCGDVEMGDSSQEVLDTNSPRYLRRFVGRAEATAGENSAPVAALEVPQSSEVHTCRFCGKSAGKKKGVTFPTSPIKPDLDDPVRRNAAGLDVKAPLSWRTGCRCRHNLLLKAALKRAPESHAAPSEDDPMESDTPLATRPAHRSTRQDTPLSSAKVTAPSWDKT